MIGSLKSLAVAVVATGIGFGPAVAAELAVTGANLGRMFNNEITDGLRIAVERAPAEREVDFLIARSQDNRPLMRATDGTWHPWTGEPRDLIECGCRFGDASVIFDLGDRSPVNLSLPITLTFGSRTAESTTYGFIVVDGP